jgi:hypothetical protein
LWALVSDMAEYIHMAHCSGYCQGGANSGSVGGRVATKGNHRELFVKTGSLRMGQQVCVSRMRKARWGTLFACSKFLMVWVIGFDEARRVCLRNRMQSIGIFSLALVIIAGRACWCRRRCATKIGQAHCHKVYAPWCKHMVSRLARDCATSIPRVGHSRGGGLLT